MKKTLTFLTFAFISTLFSAAQTQSTYFREKIDSIEYFTQIPGNDSVAFQKESSVVFDYDAQIGRYTSVKKQNGWIVQISYNDNHVVSEILFYDPAMESYGGERHKIECEYDSLERDSIWQFYDWHNGGWKFSYDITFSYQQIENGILKVSELYDDHTTLDDHRTPDGQILSTPYKYLLYNYYRNNEIVKWESFDYDWENLDWILENSLKINYDNKYRVNLMETYDADDDDWWLKNIWDLNNDSLSFVNYYKEGVDGDWFLYYSDKSQVDTSFSFNQIQLPPRRVLDDTQYIVEFEEFYSRFFYGKVLSQTSYFFEDGISEINDHRVYHYSKAKILTGEALINGYFYEEEGQEKSISITDDYGNPMEGIIVSLMDSRDDFILASDTTDVNGFYEFTGVPEGTFYLNVKLDGYTQNSTYEIEITKDSTLFENKSFSVSDGTIITNVTEFETPIKFYPNPVSEILYLDLTASKNYSIRLLNVNGQVVYQNQDVREIPVSSFEKGIYIIEISNYKEKPIIKKIIIR